MVFAELGVTQACLVNDRFSPCPDILGKIPVPRRTDRSGQNRGPEPLRNLIHVAVIPRVAEAGVQARREPACRGWVPFVLRAPDVSHATCNVPQSFGIPGSALAPKWTTTPDGPHGHQRYSCANRGRLDLSPVQAGPIKCRRCPNAPWSIRANIAQTGCSQKAAVLWGAESELRRPQVGEGRCSREQPPGRRAS